MNNVMVDIETLGVRTGSVVVSIGAIFFDPFSDKLGVPFSISLSLQEQVDKGALVDISTVKWWMDQSDEAKKAAFFGGQEVPVVEGLNEFSAFLLCSGAENLRLWSNGPSFDSVQLQSLYSRYNIKWPARYNADRDCRTIFELAFPEGTVPVEDVGTAHNALDDATWQAKAVQLCIRTLRMGLPL